MDINTTSPYGSWKSPISSSMIAESGVKLGTVVIDGNAIYWNEIHPAEKGRAVVVKKESTGIKEMTPSNYNVRTRVHEYGGGAFTVHSGVIYFSNYENHHFCAASPSQDIRELTHEDLKRYANPIFNSTLKLIYAIEEEHRSEKEVINSLVIIDPSGENKPRKIHEGYDFYSSPALNPSNTKLAFLAWNHPNMPWDGTNLFIADINPDGSLANVSQVAGGLSESIYQPRFAPDDMLYFISDRSGYWNLYRLGPRRIEECYPMEAEFGIPQWIFGSSRYDFYGEKSNYQIACIYTIKGVDYLAMLNPRSQKLETLSLPYCMYSDLHVCGENLIFIAASPTEITSLFSYNVTSKQLEIIRKSREIQIDPDYISIPEVLEFPTDNEWTAFAFYYPPKNKDFLPPSNEKPPLLVKGHGGPTGHTNCAFNLEVQFWTSRGFGFLDVNYGGSSGYGREYRKRLNGNLGIVDVHDCVNAARFLVKQEKVDQNRLVIRGGSAGGYIALAALAFSDLFKAGVSYYGISDLEALAAHTHKFESHYLESLIGAYPEQQKRYFERSPIHFVHEFTCPVLFLQGSDDKIVPPSQSKEMYEELLAKGIPVTFLLFEGEQHGFRMAETIKKTLNAELYFFSQIFHFTPADKLEPIPIQNLITQQGL